MLKRGLSMLIKAVTIALILPLFVSAGRIGDYTYEGDENDIIVANRNAQKQIALTFDDGPSEKYTKEILQILKQYDAKATFFVIGKNAEQYPELLLAEYNDGHEIGNHTYSHPNMRTVTAKGISEEISKTQRIISKIIGEAPTLFRPPGGYLSNDIVKSIGESGCRIVLWSWRQDTLDWKNTPSNIIAERVISNLRDGDIILFHDYNSGISPTPDALRALLPVLKENGYDFVTVSELTGTKKLGSSEKENESSQ